MGAGVLDLQQQRKLVTRALAAVAGAAIIYHEVVIADSAEPLLVLVGLWFLGVPPALFLDGLRRVTEATNAAVDEVTTRVEGALSDTSAPQRRREDERTPPESE